MNYQLIPKELRLIAEKVEAQQRISEGDALTLYGTNDLNALGIIANVVRERKNGNPCPFAHFMVGSARIPPIYGNRASRRSRK